MLCRRKNLVKTSSRPGVTHTVNFFSVGETHTYADLPGYGYAVLSETQRQTFKPMVEEYFRKRPQLCLVFLLQDIRRTPGDMDREMLLLLASLGIKAKIVATKADKLSNNEKIPALKTIAQELGITVEEILVSSVHSNKGVDDLHKAVKAAIKDAHGKA
jgi:GTP-binding protein